MNAFIYQKRKRKKMVLDVKAFRVEGKAFIYDLKGPQTNLSWLSKPCKIRLLVDDKSYIILRHFKVWLHRLLTLLISLAEKPWQQREVDININIHLNETN